jgi:hypothetical protein
MFMGLGFSGVTDISADGSVIVGSKGGAFLGG